MRYATLLFALILAPAALAQPCDPAQTDQVCSDTTDWHRYFPLEVGNVWHYYEHLLEEPENRWSWTITGETEVEGQTYVTLERCDDLPDGSAACEAPVLLRYDDEHDMVVRRTDDGDKWWREIPCRLSVDFNEPFHECTGPGTEGYMFYGTAGAYEAAVAIPPDVVSGDTRKGFAESVGTGVLLYAGLGATDFPIELQGNPPRLVYANVGGEQVGTPAFASCDPVGAAPGSGIVCPDTTDWRRYLPLEVGNAWQYRVRPPVQSRYEHGTEIVGETEIDGEPYFLARRCTKPLFDDLTCTSPFPIRYDEAGRTVVRRGINPNSGEVVFSQFQVSDYDVRPCPFDAPFGQSQQNCSDFGEGLAYWVSGTYGAGYEGLGDTRKEFDDLLQGTITLIAGLGPIDSENIDTATLENLLYARVGGEEVGTPVFVFPTAGEPVAAQPTATAFTAVFPNPARGPVQAQYALGAPQAVTLELIDLLGRRVRSEEVGRQAAGAHDVRLDMGGLRPGLYLLRLRGDAGAEATRRVVVL